MKIDTLGKRMISAREKLGLSQKQLAENLKISPTRLNYYEKDKREPDVLMIKKIASELKVDTNFLLGVWHKDMYEDFKHTKTDDERRYLFQKWGVPPDLKTAYVYLTDDKGDSPLTDEEFEEENDLERNAMQKNAPSTAEAGLGEEQLISMYRELNEEGKEKLVDYADDLVSSGKYIKSSTNQVGGEKLA